MAEEINFKAQATIGLELVADALAQNPAAMGALMSAVATKVEEGRRFEAVDYWFEALDGGAIFTFQFIAAAVTGVDPKKPSRVSKAKS